MSKPVCPCGMSVKKHGIPSVYGWYEYRYATKRLVEHFCPKCFESSILPRLKSHIHGCGCSFEFIWHGLGGTPEFLRAGEQAVNSCTKIERSPAEKAAIEAEAKRKSDNQATLQLIRIAGNWVTRRTV